MLNMREYSYPRRKSICGYGQLWPVMTSYGLLAGYGSHNQVVMGCVGLCMGGYGQLCTHNQTLLFMGPWLWVFMGFWLVLGMALG